ncbi:MAG: UvrB/UvrC motif-containing protein [Planctomycetaceae bacterium]
MPQVLPATNRFGALPQYRTGAEPDGIVLMKKCGRCSKPAVLHITELRHGEVQALHLCESCAKQYLSKAPTEAMEAMEEMPPAEAEVSDDLDELDQRSCPSCGITFKEFRAQGRLGCPHDYIAFEDELLPLLENIHGETEHCGKIPKRAPDSSQQQFRLIKLRSELRSAVEEERYEDAARIRDEIRHVETKPADEEPPPAEA